MAIRYAQWLCTDLPQWRQVYTYVAHDMTISPRHVQRPPAAAGGFVLVSPPLDDWVAKYLNEQQSRQ
jgi:hypothetical protein